MNKINKFFRKVIRLTIIVLFIPTIFYAKNELSIKEAIVLGLQNNFGIKIQKLEENIAISRLNQFHKTRLPKVDLFAQQHNKLNNINAPTSFTQGFYSNRDLIVGADANWMVFDGFKARIEKSRLQKLTELSKGNTTLLIENTIHLIVSAYYQVLIKKEEVKVQSEAKKLSKERYQDVQLQVKYGKNSTYELLRFENALLIDSTNTVIQLKEFESAMQSLNMALGNKYHKVYDLTDKLAYKKQHYIFEVLQQKIVALNQQLKNQYTHLFLTRNDIGLIRTERYPKIAINSGVTQNFNATKFSELPQVKSNDFNFYFNFSASFNIFDGGSVNRALEEGKIKEKIESLSVEDIKQKLSTKLQGAILNYDAQLEVILINEKLIDNLKVNLRLEKDRYQNGYSSLLDYRTLQLEYIHAQQTRLNAIHLLLMNELEIHKLTGGLTKLVNTSN